MGDYYKCDADFTNIQRTDLMTWATNFEKDRTVAKTKTERGVVSTVWLGTDHRFGGGGPPLLFETMIFAAGLTCDQEQRRTSTVDEARAVHEDCVAMLASAKEAECL